MNWTEQDDPIAWADYYVLVAAAAGSKTKVRTMTSTRKRRTSQALIDVTPTLTHSSPLAQAPAVTMSTSPDRCPASHHDSSDSLAAARAISTTPATFDLQSPSQPQPLRKLPRLSVVLVERKARHQQEHEAADAYFRHLQDQLDRERAQRAAELEAERQQLQAEEDAAEQAYAEAAAAAEAWVSRCATAVSTARIDSDDAGGAARELASRLTELVAEYTTAEWRATLGTYGSPLSTAETVSSGADQVSVVLRLAPPAS
jgi:hypothetical protein